MNQVFLCPFAARTSVLKRNEAGRKLVFKSHFIACALHINLRMLQPQWQIIRKGTVHVSLLCAGLPRGTTEKHLHHRQGIASANLDDSPFASTAESQGSKSGLWVRGTVRPSSLSVRAKRTALELIYAEELPLSNSFERRRHRLHVSQRKHVFLGDFFLLKGDLPSLIESRLSQVAGGIWQITRLKKMR